MLLLLLYWTYTCFLALLGKFESQCYIKADNLGVFLSESTKITTEYVHNPVGSFLARSVLRWNHLSCNSTLTKVVNIAYQELSLGPFKWWIQLFFRWSLFEIVGKKAFDSGLGLILGMFVAQSIMASCYIKDDNVGFVLSETEHPNPMVSFLSRLALPWYHASCNCALAKVCDIAHQEFILGPFEWWILFLWLSSGVVLWGSEAFNSGWGSMLALIVAVSTMACS